MTDWSLAKAEKWTFQEVDNNAARLARPGSPLHTDSESDGSEDLEETDILDKFVRRSTPQSGIDLGLSSDVSGQHAVADDVDFQRVFPTADSMAYVMSNGVRATYKLTPADHAALRTLDTSLKDPAWHPCRISIQEKSLLMTNNCRLVRRARRKWYRRLTEKCNMHDRHAGIPFELPPVHIEAEGTADQEVVEEVLSVLEPAAFRVGTLNMHMLLPGDWFAALLRTCDVMCLQEVTLQCLQEIVCLGKQEGFQVVSPLQRGVVPVEGFDVCLLLRASKLECMRVRISPFPKPSMRMFLQAHVLFRENCSMLVVATGHLTAGPDMKEQRSHELECIFRSLESTQNVDACIFAGDANMRRDELFPNGVSPNWRDAWMLDGGSDSLSGTWCPDTVSVDDERVRAWRFDRIYTYCQFGTKQVGTEEVEKQVPSVAMDDAANKAQPATSRVATDRGVAPKQHVPVRKSFATVQLVRNTFNVQWPCEDLDHAFVHATLEIMPLAAGSRSVSAEEVKILRPGLGSKVARRPNERESCSQKQHSHVYCGKDYEKPRLLPGMGSILEDSRRKSLFRLYTRRNCHHLNTHDPLKAMGLVANVDDQVVLTVQAAVNYLTKYLGKLGGGHSAQSRISALIDDIVCRMSDRESMTVASLLAKLFIHSAVPEEICSLEAWHLLMDLPRVLSSRHVTSLNVKDDSKSFKDLNSIEKAKTEESVIQQNKVQIYLDRFNMKVAETLPEASLASMSLFQFVSRVDRRGKSLHLRAKSNIVKEKPFLRLDARRREAGGMARMCLRLHRPFKTEAEDPVKLEDAVAVEQLHDFVQCATCPVWLKKRYAKHNRVKKANNTVQEIDLQTQNRGVALWPARGSGDPAIVSVTSPAEEPPNITGVALRPVSEAEVEGADNLSFPMNPIHGTRVINLSGPRDALPEFDDNMDSEEPLAANKFIADTPANRENIAHQHGLLWCSVARDSRYSIVDAIRHQHPPLKLVRIKAYLEALTESKPQGSKKAQSLIEQFVFLMLFIDLQRYERRGAGVIKPGLNKKALVNLANAYFQSQGSNTTPKEKKSVTSKSFAELWEYVKSATLQQCGLAVSSSPRHRVGFDGDAVDTNAEPKAGTWRQQVFCLDPYRLEHEEWEDPAEREAKRLRYVQSAMHEQSMGRPGKKLHEVTLPVDLDALTCADFDTRSEWDALNPYVHLVSSQFLADNLANSILPETKTYVLKPTQGGLTHSDAKELSANAANAQASSQAISLDPTQRSFVEHLSAWKNAYKSHETSFMSNLPLPEELPGRVGLGEPVLLLGTAGTGKTTTLQGANNLLEQDGLEGRIVRCAYTGVAASNMGAGGRTLVSLFRLSKRAFGGGLEALSAEDMIAMEEDLKGMCLLEIDEVSMVEKLVLAHVHQRLQQWRLEVFHEHHCRSKRACICGARLPFGGIKLVLAGDFGQLPPVAVPPERTLLNSNPKTAGQGRQDVNLGLRLFQQIRVVFRLRRIHRQVGQSVYKESLLRLRDAAHTKEDVQLWKTHDLTNLSSCTLSVEERKLFESQSVHLFCENRRAGQFNGCRLGEDAASKTDGSILRIWSADSTPGVERHTSDNYGGLRRVLHLAVGAPVMLTMNLRTVWNLVNGTRGHVVAVVPAPKKSPAEGLSRSGDAAMGAPGAHDEPKAGEVGGVSALQAEFVVIDVPQYVGPVMVSGHPTWVCIPKQTCRHERFRSLARTNFPLVLCYGMTVHKSQGLTFTGRCVFNMEHEPTWSPFKNMCGLAFVGFSRVTDFSKIAFKYVPDYWSFQAMAETDLFRWRSALEKRLDTLHDQTAAVLFDGKASVKDDVARHRAWSEGLRRSKLTEAEVADLTHMLSLRGVLPQPGYTDKPARRPANKAGGGRSQRKTMRGGGEVSATTSGPSTLPATQENEDEALMSDDDYCPLRGEEVTKEQRQLLAELKAEEREEQLRAATARFEEENGLVEASYSDEEAEYWRKQHADDLLQEQLFAEYARGEL